MNEEFKNQFSQEVVQSVFNEEKKEHLCVVRDEINQLLQKSQVNFDNHHHTNEKQMKLKKTTILTGHHTNKVQRDRAQTDFDLIKGFNFRHEGKEKMYVPKQKLNEYDVVGK